MVEYAVLLAHDATGFFTGVRSDAYAWASTLDWNKIGYVVLALAVLRLATWAFKPTTRF
jgi:hypothetical protein